MSLFSKIFRRNREAELLAKQRQSLLRAGRIAEGVITDVVNDEETGDMLQIFYLYWISGVEYQSSQLLDEKQKMTPDEYVPGARVTVRYSPQFPGKSVVV